MSLCLLHLPTSASSSDILCNKTYIILQCDLTDPPPHSYSGVNTRGHNPTYRY